MAVEIGPVWAMLAEANVSREKDTWKDKNETAPVNTRCLRRNSASLRKTFKEAGRIENPKEKWTCLAVEARDRHFDRPIDLRRCEH